MTELTPDNIYEAITELSRRLDEIPVPQDRWIWAPYGAVGTGANSGENTPKAIEWLVQTYGPLLDHKTKGPLT